MKKSVFKIASCVLFLSLVSCDKNFDSINTNPNEPEVVITYGLFNSANKRLIDGTRGPFPSGRMILPWVQYSAQNNYTEEDRYQFRPDSNSNLYNAINRSIKGYKNIIDLVTDPKTSEQMKLYGDLDNQLAAARIMLAYSYLQLVELYGDVPYYSFGNKDADFEALTVGTDKEVIAPKFAPHEKIYADLLTELEASSKLINTKEEKVFAKGDYVFGTTVKMKRFANSLRLRIAIRVKDVVPTAEAHIKDAIASGVMESNADNVGLQYENNNIMGSPMYMAYFAGSKRDDFNITNTMVDLLKGEGKVSALKYPADPRLQQYAAPVGTAVKNSSKTPINVELGNYKVTYDLSKYAGLPYGLPNNMVPSQVGSASMFSYNYLKADYKEMLMEYSEVAFLLCEASKFQDESFYVAGIKASMEKWGVPADKIAEYLKNKPQMNKENVITQKYIALFLQPMEAWSEYRRTGFPNTLLKPGETYKLIADYKDKDVVTKEYKFNSLVTDLTDLPARVTYPSQLTTLNAANYQAASARMGGDKMNTKLIWAKK
ncbi:SusD/RagB family nutrient-binding outer membrane lipoprotein [Myroides sp. N17-2]|uniref:SusD/RagB family nutrient-binding outer membrane lipoprotein n=1 Tax=Myroides sp. N17-2 TaxID=2030799 RepID=UPI000EFC9FA0|nr:SusD/RagB family nutrient-binding outer membrane lipoprotein [Myroides sp. N17-2]